jgi:uridine kinase
MAIDGPGGAGKSTLANQLARDLGARIIPMDAFLLPEPQHRISAIAKNYDLNRYFDEVISRLRGELPISYRKMDLATGRLGDWIAIPSLTPVIIDGIYSMEIRFRPEYDFSIFVDADEHTLMTRAIQPSFGESARSWVDNWLDGEKTYLEAQDPMGAATLILDGAKPFPTSRQVMELVVLNLQEQAS